MKTVKSVPLIINKVSVFQAAFNFANLSRGMQAAAHGDKELLVGTEGQKTTCTYIVELLLLAKTSGRSLY